MTEEELKKEFPSIELAYPLVQEAYKTTKERFDAMEKRNQTIIAFVTTLALALLGLVGDKQTPPVTISLAIAALLYLTMVAIGIYTQVKGDLSLPNPALLYQKNLGLPPIEFQQRFIYWAGEDYKYNITQINNKGKLTNFTAIFGLLTLFMLAIWISGKF
ncbi:MAG TPA: hypothetical protein VF571_07625 [Pyrinomonadaceae bacterium]|jgi:hypothetical protein